MQAHPFIISVPYKVVGITSLFVMWGICSILLYFYGHTSEWVAVADGLVSVVLFGICGYLFWYVTGILHPIQSQLTLVLLVQVVCIAGGYMVTSLFMPGQIGSFAASIPFRILFVSFGWIILTQWYHLQQIEYEEEEEKDYSQSVVEELPYPTLATKEAIVDRISVKDGSRIHLIHLNDLQYIQASGDYVTLFTLSGQYIKEQTMKYFESHLPAASFIRIHRSCIVNVEQIVRVELFGKESYQVRLRSGACLRASNTGYKLLKERLSL